MASVPEQRRQLRADAERNRVRILRAAEELFQERGFDSVSMADIAAAAGVGNGTVFRNFGSRLGLAAALSERWTDDFDRDVFSGPPPLGPGAPPAQRLVAFMGGIADLVEQSGPILRAYEALRGTGTPEAEVDVYLGRWRQHIRDQLTAARPDLDAEFHSEVLARAVAGEFIWHLVHDVGLPSERVATGLRELAVAILALPGSPNDRDRSRTASRGADR